MELTAQPRCDAAHGNAHHHRGEPQPSGFGAAQQVMTTPRVPAPSAMMLLMLAKSSAFSPPHQLDDADLDQLMPISAITLPVMMGVKDFLQRFDKAADNHRHQSGDKVNAKQHRHRISCGPPPCAFTHIPPATVTPREAKLVPCMQIIPAPMPHTRLDCRKVPMPEASSDILMRYCGSQSKPEGSADDAAAA